MVLKKNSGQFKAEFYGKYRIFEVNILPSGDGFMKGLKTWFLLNRADSVVTSQLFPIFPHSLCSCLISSSYWIAGQRPYFCSLYFKLKLPFLDLFFSLGFLMLDPRLPSWTRIKVCFALLGLKASLSSGLSTTHHDITIVTRSF